MALTDFDKFLASFITEMKECSQMRNFSIPACIKKALEDQGLEYKDGEIIKTQRRISAEAKENGYSKSENERIRKELVEYFEHYSGGDNISIKFPEWIAWLEKQDNKVIKCPQNHQSSSIPDGHIVLEDFNGGEGFYKVHLDYLNKKQVEEVEEMDRTWNKESNTSNEIIKNCIGMCLTDANEQRFKDYGTNLKECLAWLEKQGTSYTKRDVDDAYVEGMAFAKDELEKQKSAWSKEDEERFQSCLCILQAKGFMGVTETINTKWLKSLKQKLK